MAQETSIIAYQEIQSEGVVENMQETVYNAFLRHPESTDAEITKYLNLSDPNKVRPRRVELVNGHRIENCGKRKCKITGRTAYIWKVSNDI